MVPEFVRSSIASMKTDVRARIDVEKAFLDVRDAMDRETELIRDAREAGRSVIPDISFDMIQSGSVPGDVLSQIRRRGCVIIRGVFEIEQAVGWNEDIGEYLEQNDYVQRARDNHDGDRFFDGLDAGNPQIFGIYWSRPQIAARQAVSMAATKQFLNNMWDTAAPAGPEFDPNHDYTYADRIRRRAPGDSTLGLSPHMDSGSFERWVDPAFQKIYEPIFAGAWQDFDPWKAAHRTQTREYASPTVCSVFRTFQGWTALTQQGPNTGTLQLFPVVNSIAYPLLRSLQDDVPKDELLFADPGRALGVDERSHPEIVAGMVSIPEVEPGDTVWWHPDIIHAVEDVHEGSGYSNVIYVGASPRCAKNLTYVRQQAEHFLTGRSSPDFKAEDFEVDFLGRATVDDLTDVGRGQMGL